MNMKELQPIIDLMTLQEERLVKKIDELHEDVKDVYDQAKLTNERIKQAELDIYKLRVDFEHRQKTCGANIDNLKPNIQLTKHLNNIVKRPKTVIFLVVAFIVFTQALVTEAIKGGWVVEIVRFLKP